MRKRLLILSPLALALTAALASSGASIAAQEPAFGWTRFEQYLESLRQQAGIPGLTALVLQDQQVVWERGFGFQDVENGIRATPDTGYHVVGLTQTVSAAVLLDCVERGRLDLDQPVQRFAPDFDESAPALRHLLTHTSEGLPGLTFLPNLSRYALLTFAIEQCWSPREPFRQILKREVLDRFALIDSVPGQDVILPEVAELLPGEIYDDQTLERYRAALGRLAKPYKIERGKRPTLATYPANTLDASSGLVTTARDLARFYAAIDGMQLLEPGTLTAMWTPPVQAVLPGVPAAFQTPLPHAMGWFAWTYQGDRIVWQYGYWPEVTSSLVIKVPSQNLTFILLANGDRLITPAQIQSGDITSSLFVRLILRFFL